MSDHYKGEQPSYVANPDKAFEIAYDEVTLESPQQQPELRPESPNHIQPCWNKGCFTKSPIEF